MPYGSTLGSPVSKMIGRTGAWSKERSTVEHCSCTCGSSIIRMIIWPCMCTAVLQIRGLGGSVSWPTQYVSIAINPTYPTQSHPKLTDIRGQRPLLKRSVTGWLQCPHVFQRENHGWSTTWFKWCWLAHTVIELGPIFMACGSNHSASRSRCHPQRWKNLRALKHFN